MLSKMLIIINFVFMRAFVETVEMPKIWESLQIKVANKCSSSTWFD